MHYGLRFRTRCHRLDGRGGLRLRLFRLTRPVGTGPVFFNTWDIGSAVRCAVFIKGGGFENVRRNVQLVKVCSNQIAVRVVPRASADPVAGRKAARTIFSGAEVYGPYFASGPCDLRESGAMCVCALPAAKAATLVTKKLIVVSCAMIERSEQP